MKEDVLEIPNIQLISEIGRGADSIVYRAERAGQTYAVKVLKSLSATREDAFLRFRREAGILARVHHAGLATIMEVGQVAGHPYLIMEYVEGQTLASVLAQSLLAQDAIIRLANEVIGALIEVHRQDLVHRDIKPQNILIDKKGAARLIDFGFATRATTEGKENGQIAGTFIYSAPEQTGMLKRPVDRRSDLYALGVVLFECATGQPPFRAEDVGELIRQHAVIPAPDVCLLNPAISPALAAIIAKLLHKDPDDRYQTGKGLLLDLEQVEVLDTAFQAGQSSPLGKCDHYPSILDDVALLGRQAELDLLQQTWQHVLEGKGLFVLVQGETGSGKGRLVGEFLQQIRAQESLVLEGRAVRGNPVPFAPLREALDTFLSQIRRLTDTPRQEAEAQLWATMGEFAPLLKRLSPRFSDFLKDIPDISETANAQDIFFDAVVEFLLALARTHDGAVLFLDDVQWIDEASRQILKRLAHRLREAPLLLVGTSRNGPNSLADLQRVIAGMEESIIARITLGALREEDVARLIEALLGGSQLDQSIVRQITIRSNGNPFAVKEYIASMLDAGLLRPSWGSWVVDMAGLEQLHLPTDILQLAIRRLGELSVRAREILRTAALLGLHFQPELLATLHGVGLEAILESLREAIEARLITQEVEREFLFVHSRVREALLALIEPGEARALHQRISEVLDEQGAQGDEAIYALAQHYALGVVNRNPKRVFQTNLAAGIQALQHYADEEAYTFLEQAYRSALAAYARPGGTFMPPDTDLEEALGIACARTNRVEEAITHFEKAIRMSNDRLRSAQF
nr:protein kinase [Ardenticatenales bacterium]